MHSLVRARSPGGLGLIATDRARISFELLTLTKRSRASILQQVANNRAVPSGGGSNLKVGGTWRARAYKGVWGRSPQRGPVAEPLVRGWSWKVFRHYTSKGQAIFAPLPSFWKCWNISQTLLTVHKNTHILRVREREQTELSHLQCIWCTKPHCPQSLPSNI